MTTEEYVGGADGGTLVLGWQYNGIEGQVMRVLEAV